MYDGNLAGFCVWLCEEVYAYVGLYKDVEVEDEHGTTFILIYVVVYVQDKTKTWVTRTY